MDNNFLKELCQKLLKASMNSENTEEVYSGLVKNQFQLVNVMESLGDILTNTDLAIRERGISFTTQLLEKLPKDFLKQQELTFLIQFYCEKLKDHHTLLPATFKGLHVLLKSNDLSVESAHQVMKSMQTNINIQSQVKTDRYVIFQIFQEYFNNFLVQDKYWSSESEFLFFIITAVEGETDPINLLFVFKTLTRLFNYYKGITLAQDLFDLFSGYFPVDFTSVKTDSVTVTRQDLSDALRQLLCSTIEFNKFIIPLTIEKLESTLKVAKLDSYALLTDCLNNMTTSDCVDSLLPNINLLWKFLMRDVLPGNDADVNRAALASLGVLAGILPVTIEVKELLDDTLTSAKSMLNRPEDNLFDVTLNVMFTVCKEPSGECTKFVLPPLIQHLIDVYHQLDSINTRSKLLLKISPVLLLCKQSFMINLSQNNCYVDLLDLYVNNTYNVDNADICRIAFCALCPCVGHLNRLQRTRLLCNVWSVMTHETMKSARDEALRTLSKLSVYCHNEIMDNFIKPNLNISIENETVASLELKLHCYQYLVLVPDFTHILVPDLLNIIFNTSYYCHGLSSLLSAYKMDDAVFPRHLAERHQLPSMLIAWFITNHLLGQDILEIVLQIIESCLAKLYVSQQQIVVDNFLSTFVPILANVDKPLDQSFINQLSLLEMLIGCVDKQVDLSSLTEHIPKVFNKLLTNSWDGEMVTDLCCKTISYVINKVPLEISTELVDNLLKCEWYTNVKLFVWLVKSVNLTGTSQLDEINRRYFEMLSNNIVGYELAVGIKTILSEHPTDLYKYPNKKLLFKQRLFSYSNTTIDSYKSSSASVKKNYQLTMLNLLASTPLFVYKQTLADYMLLLCDCLMCEFDDDVIVQTCVDVLERVLDEDTCEYINPLLCKLLSVCKTSADMKCRISALRCVRKFAGCPTHLLLHYRQKVLQDLLPCIDDKKRLVRCEAVRTRSRWFLVGAPGEQAIFNT